jgi:cytochrome d ubiquinol oxidase subunit I
LLTGWYVTEIGRQPWVIQGELKTSEAVSSTLTGAEATLTLVAFVVLYVGLLLTALYILKWLVREELRSLGVRESSGGRWHGPIPWVSSDD